MVEVFRLYKFGNDKLMDAKVKIRLGLIAAIVTAVYYSLGVFAFLILTYFIPKWRLLFGGLFLLHLIPLSNSLLYIFAVIKRRLSIAKWSYLILSFCIILSAVVWVFKGLFVKGTSDNLIIYTVLLILTISVPVVLFLISLSLGISGLKKVLQANNGESMLKVQQ